MATLTFNAFSFLQKKLKARHVDCVNAPLEFTEGQTAAEVLKTLGIGPEDLEGLFVNGRIAGLHTRLYHGDRLAVFPPGTPGPYRLLLGLVNSRGETKNEDL